MSSAPFHPVNLESSQTFLLKRGHTATAVLAENRTHKSLNEKLGEADDPFAPQMLDFFNQCIDAEIAEETF